MRGSRDDTMPPRAQLALPLPPSSYRHRRSAARRICFASVAYSGFFAGGGSKLGHSVIKFYYIGKEEPLINN